jgi:hypothetical protein
MQKTGVVSTIASKTMKTRALIPESKIEGNCQALQEPPICNT